MEFVQTPYSYDPTTLILRNFQQLAFISAARILIDIVWPRRRNMANATVRIDTSKLFFQLLGEF
jgi:hypothetical protein